MQDVSLGLAHEAEVTLRKVGMTPEDWDRIRTDVELAKQIVELLHQRPVFRVTVDHGKSLADMIADGKYDWKNDDITAEHFPIQGKGQQEVEVILLHFNRAISSKEAIAEMDKAGYKPALIEHLLALGDGQPDLQRQFPIVALGSVWQSSGSNCDVPYLYGCGVNRSLNLRWFECEWSGVFRFAAVRK